MEPVLFYIFVFIWIGIGLYMMYSATHKNKGLELPKKNFYGIFATGPKKGQEWLLFLIGLVWVVISIWVLLGVMFDW